MDRHREAAIRHAHLRQAPPGPRCHCLSRWPSGRHGLTLFGQSCLMARRVNEAGGKFPHRLLGWLRRLRERAWDTHANHYPRLKEYLLPGFDQAIRHCCWTWNARLLDETLVLWMSEHGQHTVASTRAQRGRDHWSRAYWSRWPAVVCARRRRQH